MFVTGCVMLADRPKGVGMKQKYTRFQIGVEALCVLALVGMVVFIAVSWGQLPDQIPAHYNFAGEIDRWGSKNEFLLFPGIGIFLYLLLTVVSSFPQIWNMPAKVTEENKGDVYRCTKDMLLVMKAEMILVFFAITYLTTKCTAIPWVYLAGMLVAIFGTLIYMSVRISRVARQKK